MALDSIFRTGKTAAKKAAKRQEDRELERLRNIDIGMERIGDVFDSKFNDAYYSGVRQAATNYATQDLNSQFRDAQRNLMFALARSGTSISSEAARRQGTLASEHEKGLYQADSLGALSERQARSDVERERASAVAQLQATADPGAAASAARSASEFLSINPAMNTLGPLFQNVTAGLAGAMRPTYDAYGQPVNRGGPFSRSGAATSRGRVIV